MADPQQQPMIHTSAPGRALSTALIIGGLVGAGIAALVHAAVAKPPARECLDVCRTVNMSAFYAADGACLCVPACPACTQVTAPLVEVTAPAKPLTGSEETR